MLGGDCFGCKSARGLGCPVARPMPLVAPGVSELRVRGGDGVFRVFYFASTAEGVLVFHAFAKKTQRTPAHEIELAGKRLEELLNG